MNRICPRCQIRYFQKYNYSLMKEEEAEITRKFVNKLEYEEINCEQSCVACLGILDEKSIKNCMESILKKTKEYTFTTFKITVLQPVQLIICNNIALKILSKKSGKDEEELNSPLEVKDALKVILEPKLESLLNAKCSAEGSLEIHVILKHEQTEDHLLTGLEKLAPKSFLHAKRQLEIQSRKRRRDDLSYFTISSVTNAVISSTPEEICSIMKNEYLIKSAEVFQVNLLHKPLYLAGRYNKYSRKLSQTPWLIDGVRKSEMSVEEYLTGPMISEYAGQSSNFSSSGREDCDVRMLGTGRPFIVEIINPKKFGTEYEIVRKIESEINKSTEAIKVTDLQIIDKSDVKKLKEGEDSKTKSYSAYCITELNENSDREKVIEILKDLNKSKNLKIFQKTPLRVLHRRTLCVRPRIIESMKVTFYNKPEEFGNKNFIFFKLNLTTQAGTYVKEFIHGDFGRTTPSLSNMLNEDVDIVNLDVESVNVDWPKPLKCNDVKLESN